MAVRRLAEDQPESFAFSAANRDWAEATIRKFPEGRQASAVIPLLWRAQEQEGWVTKPAIEGVAGILAMPLIRVLEVATFYTMFHLEPVGRKAHVQVCGTTPCMLRGSGDIIDVCRGRISEHQHELSADGAFSWEEVECLGACVNAPMVQIGSDNYEDLTRESFDALLDAFARGERPRPGPQIDRQTSTPITGLTSLTEISYADDDVAEPDNRDFPRTGASDRAVPDHAAANVGDGEPRMAVADVAGGEQTESEQRRRKGLPPQPPTDGADPSGPEAANQNIGRVDPTGRSDEAASAATASRGAEAPAQSSGEPTPIGSGATDADRGAQPRSDRDTSKSGKEG